MVNGFLILILVAASAPQTMPPVSYSDSFSDRYSEASDSRLEFHPETPLEPLIEVQSALGASTAQVLRTDGVKVFYENALAHISVESKLCEDIYFKVKGFRTVTASWIGERYLFIRRDIGHVAAIEEIYDLVERKWLLQQSVHYRWP